jgi:ppGpp synthetase/RelA/SpoT-type nucleotidyltranferase
MNNKDNLISDYKSNRGFYEAFTGKVKDLIVTILEEAGVRQHTVVCRTKAVESLQHKIEKSDKEYSGYDEITDLSGVRIICLSQLQAKRVAEVVRHNFDVIDKLSVDKIEILDADRFGYLSLHYVAKINQDRIKLPEYSKYKDLLCEIQIRTLLQHAWAEIEHDLGYKAEVAIPKQIRRRFYRLAGLLELGDDEFDKIINEASNYSRKIDEEISKSPEKIGIDIVSLRLFIKKSVDVARIDQKIATGSNCKIFNDKIDKFDRNALLARLKVLRIGTIDELEKNLKENEKLIIESAKIWLKGIEPGSLIVEGVSISYLTNLLAIRSKDSEQIKQFGLRSGVQVDKIDDWTKRMIRAAKILFPDDKII